MVYLINGESVEREDFNISVEDMVVWRGDGIFEAIQVHDGFPFGLERHLQRLTSSANKLSLDIDISNIKDWILEASSLIVNGYVRTIVTRGREGEHSNVYILKQELISFPEEFTLNIQKAPWHPAGDFTEDDFSAIGVKSTSYALNMQHTRLAKDRDFSDALLVSRDNILLEGPTFTFCWVKGEKIFTPNLDLGILDSVTRQYLFLICQENNIYIEEVKESSEVLNDANEAFILSTAKHAVSISRIDNITFSDTIITNRLQGLFTQLIESERNKFFAK